MENLEFLLETFEEVCSTFGIDSAFFLIDEDTFEVSPDPCCTECIKDEIKISGTLYYIKKSDLKILENEVKKRLKVAV